MSVITLSQGKVHCPQCGWKAHQIDTSRERVREVLDAAYVRHVEADHNGYEVRSYRTPTQWAVQVSRVWRSGTGVRLASVSHRRYVKTEAEAERVVADWREKWCAQKADKS